MSTVAMLRHDHNQTYINRELSWLEFNRRVLEEALDDSHPLLERVKFLAIFSSNLDEFFMVRVSALRRQLSAGRVEVPPDGMTPAEQLAELRRQLMGLLDEQMTCWQSDLLPRLHEAGIHVLDWSELPLQQRELLNAYFEREIFPVLTPLAFDSSHPFPHISNLSLNLAVVVHDQTHGERFARLKVPDSLPRLVAVPADTSSESLNAIGLGTSAMTFVWIEQLVAAHLDLLFPGLEVRAVFPFRVTRDADLEIEEDEAADLLEAIEECVEMRDFGSGVRLEVDRAMPERVRELLGKNLGIAPYLHYTAQGPVGLADLIELTRLERPELKDPPLQPRLPTSLGPEISTFAAIRQSDVLLFHPYDSFSPVVDFIREAARDPSVLAIKQTLYRVGPNSPIVAALLEAREHRKQVAVLVELKARFDEENNIAWARALEQAGAHVVYGVLGLKTHAKMCLVVRREHDGIVRYVHLGTGNYSPVTSRIYTDIGYFTCDEDTGADVSDLFNALTGYSHKAQYRKLLVAPGTMRQDILERIEREIAHQRRHDRGHLAFKMNALVDQRCIQALYRAAQTGVRVDLQVRGICCLRPGIPGLSENITVSSIVGRFLEHSRMYYFHNGGDEELWLGSADLMPRNLDRRVETLFPVADPTLRGRLLHELLEVHLQDTAKARRLLPDGSYQRLRPADGAEALDAQRWMQAHHGEARLPAGRGEMPSTALADS